MNDLSLLNDQCLASIVRMLQKLKRSNFLRLNMVNVKLCMMVVLIELYLFMLLSAILIVFQGHRDVKQF